jgi:hypothetical protein
METDMPATHMPGFTASVSVYSTPMHYQSAAIQAYSCKRQRIVSQLGIGGGRGLGGFWTCLVCVAACTIIVGDVVECYDACANSGACEVVAVAVPGRV